MCFTKQVVFALKRVPEENTERLCIFAAVLQTLAFNITFSIYM